MKIGFLSQPISGHLNPMTALARKLQSRGHEVVFISVLDGESIIRGAGLDFVPFCEQEYPLGSATRSWGGVSKMHGLDVAQFTVHNVLPGLIAAGLEHLEKKIVETGVEALVIDTIYFYLELVPMHLGIPFVHIWNILHVDFSGATPPSFFNWPHEVSPEALARNKEGARQLGIAWKPIAEAAAGYAEKNGLKIDWSDYGYTASKLAIISQTPKEFDFPGSPWPPQFHYAGPLHEEGGRAPIDFPWEKLDGKPLIYASLGTLVNGLEHIYRTILAAVAPLSDVQLVISVGRNLDLEELGKIPSNTVVVRSAPQLELLKRASLCITHAGLNTALEALAQGVPLVAIPIGYEQPGVAARIAHHGVGEFVEVDDLTVEGLSELIDRVRNNPSYRDKALYFQDVIAKTNGPETAADVIERVFEVNRGVDVPELIASQSER
ncbi:MGT family glycosyltransferase [Silvibacterium bohemicum]|uniref:MGT family glycosyltransferase n=1 Tax=Silvibacterium bohemicum TaxID=1577686 RepID=A0A841K9D1_9BACT|nr:glycosyltransferase [Silvibacterium bohemicum]MBB6147158.1 MGT family glycosyltransferase [Silvibacterium bohemicum]